MRRTPVRLAVVAHAACLALAVDPRPACAEKLTFKWPLPAKVTVTERVVKGGVPATLRYEVGLTPAADGERLALRLTGFKFLDVPGKDSRDPAVRRQVENALRLASALPTVVLSRDGAFEDITDFGRTIDQLIASMRVPAKDKAALTKVMKSPEMMDMLKERSGEFWNVWVGLWAGKNLEPGRSIELSQQTPMPDGSVLERPLKVTHHGPAGPPDHVRLSFLSTLEGGSGTKALRGFIQGMLQQMQAASGQRIPPEMVEEMRVSSGGEVITDPATLRPVAARSHRELTLTLKGQPPHSELETHEYSFAWARPAPRAPSPAGD